MNLAVWKRALLGVNLTLSLLLGLAAGALAAILTGHWLLGKLPASPPPAPAAAGVVARPLLTDYEVVLQRNLFSDRGPLPYSFRGEESSEAQASAPPAQTRIALHGTVAGGKRPLALLLVGSELVIVAEGEELPGGGLLERVERNQVTLRDSAGRSVTLPLVEGRALATAAAPAAARRTASPERPQEYQVEQLSETRWRIPASEAERARTQFNTLLSSARMTPNLVGGETQGFLVVQVQPRSLLSQLGIRPRDVLMEVNGIPLDSAEKALQIFYQLREARRVNLALVRGDERLTFEYEVN